MVWMLCIPIVILYLAAAHLLVNFFINEPSELALTSGVRFLYIVAPFYFIVSVKLVADGILRGAGLVRVTLAKILAVQIGYLGIWCAWPIGWTIATALSIKFYRGEFRKS